VEPLARETGAAIVRPAPLDVTLPGYQRHNFEVAVTAARALRPVSDAAVAAAGAHAQVPGRLQVVGHDPLTLYDGAHNPSGVAALVDALPDRHLVAVVSILDDKDAAAMLRTLLPRCAAVVFTASSNRRALPPATLASLAAQLGGPPAEIEPDARRAVERARALAGPDGAVVATGSIYLMADLLSPPGARRASAL
jgi:dihydrofolate synthase/folylpolyglutamate synthase